MDIAQMKPSEMIADARMHAALARDADARGATLMAEANELQLRGAGKAERLNDLWDQADAAWGAMEDALNILVPLMVSPELDQILARLQAAFEAEGQ
jgi:hypothetical protein